MKTSTSCVVCLDQLEGSASKFSIFEKDPVLLTCLVFDIHRITGIQVVYREDGGLLCQECYFHLVKICELEQEFKEKFRARVLKKPPSPNKSSDSVKRKVQKIWPGPNSGLVPIKNPKLLKCDPLRHSQEPTNITDEDKQYPLLSHSNLLNAHDSIANKNQDKIDAVTVQHKQENDPMKVTGKKLQVEKKQNGEDMKLAKIDLIPNHREDELNKEEAEEFGSNILSEYEDFEGGDNDVEFESTLTVTDVKLDPDSQAFSDQKVETSKGKSWIRHKGRYCYVLGCFNHDRMEGIKFFPFPPVKKDPERRNIWLSAIGRSDKDPARQERICQYHFVNGTPSTNITDADYSPSVFFESTKNE